MTTLANIKSASTSPVTWLAHCLAGVLDSVALLAAKVGLIDGAHVQFVPGRSWRVDAWKEGRSWLVELGGFEACIDLKR